MTSIPPEAAFRRWDFGMDNPNKAAAILAFALLVLLSASLRARRGWIRWSCTAAACIVGCGLVLTFSRGGLVAFAVGAAVLCAGAWKGPGKMRRMLPAAILSTVLAVAAMCTGFAGRMANSLPADDASVGNRLAIWRSVPAMVVDAPGGWGLGSSGGEYMSWYQPLDSHERYRTLVNSHLTWLVELGWAERTAYTCGMLLLLGMGVVRMKVRGDPLPLAVLASFAASAFFSSVAEEWLVCAVPLAMLVPLLGTFALEATARMRRVSLAAALSSGCLLLGGVAVLGVFCRPLGAMSVRKSFDGATTVLGEGSPSAWVVADPETMGGCAFGRLLRGFAATPEGMGRAYGVARDIEAVPDDVRRLALCGRAADADAGALARFSLLADVRVLSPSHPGKWLAARANAPYDIRVFCGEFAPSCPEDDADGLTVVVGAAEFIPDWPRLAFAP